MEPRSCLYDCVIVHRRLRPKAYRFRHRIMMLYADLDELPSLTGSTRLMSYAGRNLYSFGDADYFPTGTAGDLRERVREFLRLRDGRIGEVARIRLLTLPRILGYLFNPISIYFCFDGNERALCAIAEVGNTFRERKLFLLPDHDASSRGRFRLRIPKQYYVSPFTALDVSFDFDLRVPAGQLRIRIQDWDSSGKLLDSLLWGERVSLCDAQLLRFAVKFPALTLKVIALIHWHALRLALKRVPWHPKAARPEAQREVLQPSAVLAAYTRGASNAHEHR